MKILKLIFCLALLLVTRFSINAQQISFESLGANGNFVTVIANDGFAESYSEKVFFKNGFAHIKLPTKGLYWINNTPIYVTNDAVKIIFTPEGEEKRFRNIKSIESNEKSSKLFLDLFKHWQAFTIKSYKKDVSAKDMFEVINMGDEIIDGATQQLPAKDLARFYNRALSLGKAMDVLKVSPMDQEIFNILNEVSPTSPLLEKLSQSSRMNFYNQYFAIAMKKEGLNHLDSYKKVGYIATHMKPSNDLDKIIENFTNYTFRFKGLDQNLIEVLPILRSKTNNSKLLKAVDEKVTEYSKTSINKTAPEFILNNLDGKKVKLSDFKGKVVVVDIWATWCSVCIEKMPHFLKYREQYKNNENVVFLTVSIDNDFATKNWEKFLIEHQLSGIDLIAAGEDGKKFKTEYKTLVVPKYLLIGKTGKMILDPGTLDEEFVSKMKTAIMAD